MTGNNKNSALIGAVLFHVILILILIFSTLSTPPPTFPDPEGITVDIGMDETGMGETEPLFNPNPEPITPVTETETEPVSEPEVADNSPLTQEDDSPTEEEIRKEKELAEKKK
ncbi:MAG: hypothetical protein IPO21_04445 [Bacteroidales bacterium]|nr:hypothetical protein [Bacteroidales bacterium]